MQRLCIYCGSSFGNRPAYREAADAVGRWCARNGVGVVYGGGGVGLMGVVADAALAEGGEVIGVIPTLLIEREKEHHNLTQLIEVTTMHERKKIMADHADAFLALPGGIGTLEELAEIMTWRQLGYHDKPIGLLDTDGYFNPLLSFLEHMEEEGFLLRQHRDSFLVDRNPEALLEKLKNSAPPRAAAQVS